MLVQQNENKIYNTAIYCRLSKDDGTNSESSSITTQKEMLTNYVNTQGFKIYDYYIDDGVSGKNFDRPAFKRMLDDIQSNKVNCVITKDLSRLGRNYIETGMYIEMIFPENNVRYIALSDGVDTSSKVQSNTDIAAFHNIINDMYLKDISKKIKASYKTRLNQGKYMATSTPFGYLKDPNDKNHLIIDERYANLIRRIFKLAQDGLGISKIRQILTDEKIPRPAACACDDGLDYSRFFEDDSNRYVWSNNSVRNILRNPVYAGHIVGYKRVSISMKSNKRLTAPPEEWTVIKDTHEPIVSDSEFELVQSLLTSRRKAKVGASGYDNIFSGLIKCEDCGYAMRTSVANRKKKEEPIDNIVYCCNNYATYGKKGCTQHRIEARELHRVVLEDIRIHSEMASTNDSQLFNDVMKNIDVKGKERIKILNADLKKAEKRLATVDNMFSNLFEQNATGKITERNYLAMSKKYEVEQSELDDKISRMQLELNEENSTVCNIQLWIDKMKELTYIETLTAPIINSLIDKITVSEPKVIDGDKVQFVNIYYKFVGCVS